MESIDNFRLIGSRTVVQSIHRPMIYNNPARLMLNV